MLAGHATADGTRRYAERFADAAPGHFRDAGGLCLSSVGMGTYLGEPDEATDAAYGEALASALQRGCNVLDSAINYRCQRSERVIGDTLATLCAEAEVRRDEMFIATKGGYLPFDGTYPASPGQYFTDAYVRTGILQAADIVGGCHSLAPGYLRNQLEQSRRNLGVETIDLYYVHNPEQQLDEIPRDAFRDRLREAFTALEEAVGAGLIRWYGTATWNGYREAPQSPGYLSLEETVRLADEASGGQSHFRAVQLPYNLAMTDAFTRPNQMVGDERVPVLEAARRLGIAVTASASVLQGRLASGLPREIGQILSGFDSDAQRALQFVRSTPGVTTALVGMSRRHHVLENLAIASVAPAGRDQLLQLFTRSR